MTFRHPLRNEWDAVAADFARLAAQTDAPGVMARAMTDAMPGFLATLERERDNATPPAWLYDAVAAVCGMMIENAIEAMQHHGGGPPPRAALHHMLARIEGVVAPRVAGAAKLAGLILPPGYGS